MEHTPTKLTSALSEPALARTVKLSVGVSSPSRLTPGLTDISPSEVIVNLSPAVLETILKETAEGGDLLWAALTVPTVSPVAPSTTEASKLGHFPSLNVSAACATPFVQTSVAEHVAVLVRTFCATFVGVV